MNSTSTFKVFTSYAIPSKNWLVYHGVMKSGTVEPGMFLDLGVIWNVSLTLRIHEVIDVKEVDKDEEQLWLIHYYEDELEKDVMLGMRVFDEELGIIWEGED